MKAIVKNHSNKEKQFIQKTYDIQRYRGQPYKKVFFQKLEAPIGFFFQFFIHFLQGSQKRIALQEEVIKSSYPTSYIQFREQGFQYNLLFRLNTFIAYTKNICSLIGRDGYNFARIIVSVSLLYS